MPLEEPDQGIFITGMKAKILQSTLSAWYGTQIFMLSPVMGHNICDVGQFTAAMKETDKSWKWIQAVGAETGRELRSQKGIPVGYQGPSESNRETDVV